VGGWTPRGRGVYSPHSWGRMFASGHNKNAEDLYNWGSSPFRSRYHRRRQLFKTPVVVTALSKGSKNTQSTARAIHRYPLNSRCGLTTLRPCHAIAGWQRRWSSLNGSLPPTVIRRPRGPGCDCRCRYHDPPYTLPAFEMVTPEIQSASLCHSDRSPNLA
jgi:hypothetical protein